MNRNLIVKHNQIIESKYNMSLIESKIIAKLASVINKNDIDFKQHIFNASELLFELGLGKENYTALQESVDKLLSRIIEIKLESYSKTGKRDVLKTTFLSSCIYSYSTSQVILSFDPVLKPYFLQLKENFTKYYLEDILNLNSFYAIRIYELLKQYEKIKERTIQINEFREILEIQNEYKKYNDFKKNVLEIAKREINNKTDLNIDYEEIKTIRKVIAIKFIISKKQQEIKQIDFKNIEIEELSLKNENLEKLLKLLPNSEPFDIWEKKLNEALKKHSFEMLEEDLIYAVKHKPVNLLNYFEKSIKNGHFSAYEEAKKKAREQTKKNKLDKELKLKQEKEKLEQEQNNKINEKYNNLSLIELEYFENKYNLLPENIKNSVPKEFLIKAMIKEFFEKK